jgi:ribosome maturation factor RimP
MAGSVSTDAAARVAAALAPVAAELGAEVLDVEVAEGAPRVVRLVVDAAIGADGLPVSEGIDIDRIAELSRRAGTLLDELDPIAASYTLEVTSPGTDRPLATWRDFARNRGRRVRVMTATGETLEGEVERVAEDRVALTVDGGEREVVMSTIERASVVLPW